MGYQYQKLSYFTQRNHFMITSPTWQKVQGHSVQCRRAREMSGFLTLGHWGLFWKTTNGRCFHQEHHYFTFVEKLNGWGKKSRLKS